MGNGCSSLPENMDFQPFFQIPVGEKVVYVDDAALREDQKKFDRLNNDQTVSHKEYLEFVEITFWQCLFILSQVTTEYKTLLEAMKMKNSEKLLTILKHNDAQLNIVKKDVDNNFLKLSKHTPMMSILSGPPSFSLINQNLHGLLEELSKSRGSGVDGREEKHREDEGRRSKEGVTDDVGKSSTEVNNAGIKVTDRGDRNGSEARLTEQWDECGRVEITAQLEEAMATLDEPKLHNNFLVSSDTSTIDHQNPPGSAKKVYESQGNAARSNNTSGDFKGADGENSLESVNGADGEPQESISIPIMKTDDENKNGSKARLTEQSEKSGNVDFDAKLKEAMAKMNTESLPRTTKPQKRTEEQEKKDEEDIAEYKKLMENGTKKLENMMKKIEEEEELKAKRWEETMREAEKRREEKMELQKSIEEARLKKQEEQKEEFRRKKEELEERHAKVMEELRRQLEEVQKETEESMRKSREEMRMRVHVFWECVRMKIHFEEKEDEWASWLRILKTAVDRVKIGFGEIEQVRREEQLEMALSRFHLKVHAAHRLLYEAYYEVKELSAEMPDRLFLKILQRKLTENCNMLWTILITIDKNPENIVESMKMLSTDYNRFEIPSTWKLRELEKKTEMAGTEEIKDPEKYEEPAGEGSAGPLIEEVVESEGNEEGVRRNSNGEMNEKVNQEVGAEMDSLPSDDAPPVSTSPPQNTIDSNELAETEGINEEQAGEGYDNEDNITSGPGDEHQVQHDQQQEVNNEVDQKCEEAK